MRNEQYESICKDKFNEVLEEIKQNTNRTNEIFDRLFKDNGSKSVQTRLNDHQIWIDDAENMNLKNKVARHSLFVSVFNWVFGLCLTASIGVIAWKVRELI